MLGMHRGDFRGTARPRISLRRSEPDGSAYLEAGRKSSPHLATALKALQIDRRRTSAGYPFKTFEQMACDTPAKTWLIKGVLAKGVAIPVEPTVSESR